MGFRDGGGGQAQGGDTGAGAGLGGQVAGHGEEFGGEGDEPHLVAPAVEAAPLGSVGAAGVVGEDCFQGLGHAPVGGGQLGEPGGLNGDYIRAGGGGHGRVSGGGIWERFRRVKDAR